MMGQYLTFSFHTDGGASNPSKKGGGVGREPPICRNLTHTKAGQVIV